MPERFKIVPSSYLILIKDGKILLVRRYNTGFEDGNYSLVSGHVEENETFREALVREALEECGIIVSENDIKIVHVIHRKASADIRVDLFIHAEKWSGIPRIMEPNKCDDMQWFPLDALPANTIPYIRQAISSIRNKIIYSEYGW